MSDRFGGSGLQWGRWQVSGRGIMRLLIPAACAVFMLAGCGDSATLDESSRSTRSPAVEWVEETPTATPTPTPTTAAGQLTDTERDALRTAYGSEERYSQTVPGAKPQDRLAILQGICQRGGYSVALVNGPSEGQRQELTGAAVLCPDSQGIAALLATVAVPRYPPGTLVVGQGIPAGTYQGTSTGSCYWEVTDEAGNIIANNYVGREGPVQADIPAGAYAFDSSGCGSWVAVGQ